MTQNKVELHALMTVFICVCRNYHKKLKREDPDYRFHSKPKVGQLVSAQFVQDDVWYRAYVLAVFEKPNPGKPGLFMCFIICSPRVITRQHRAFSVARPATWNRLPAALCPIHSTSFFSTLKTVLFVRGWAESASERAVLKRRYIKLL